MVFGKLGFKPSGPLRAAAATCLLAAALTGSAIGRGGEASPPQKHQALGFVVTKFTPTMNDNPDCPAGLNKGMAEIVLEGATPEVRARLTSPAGQGELRRLASRTPDGKGSLCVNPDTVQVPVPPLKVVQGSGRVAGLDLDGRPTANHPQGDTCGHANFADARGRPTIDNQLYRLDGCIKSRRPGGNSEQSAMSELINGSYAIVVELSGVDDRKNDDDVTIDIYSSPDPTPFTSSGKPLANGSMTVHPDPRYHARAKARLVNGVLRSDSFDLIVNYPVVGLKLEHDIRKARVELTLKDDGTIEGLLGGYYPIASYYRNQITMGNHAFFGDGAAATTFACPAMHKALKQYADGLRDPATGECRGLSMAYTIKAVPAFVIKPRAAPAANMANP